MDQKYRILPELNIYSSGKMHATTLVDRKKCRKLYFQHSVLTWAEEIPLRTSSCNPLGIQEPMSYSSRNPRFNIRMESGLPSRILGSTSICIPVSPPTPRPRSLIYTRKGTKCQQQAICETSPDLTSKGRRSHICLRIPRSWGRPCAAVIMGSIWAYGYRRRLQFRSP